MKLAKAFVLTLVALLLTGCYTQLQYTQTAQKAPDKNVERSWSGEEQADEKARQAQQVQQSSEYAYEGDNYVPVYYKDYEYQNRWQDCGCNPYKTYNFYGDTYLMPSHSSYYSYHKPYHRFSVSPFYAWHMGHHYGHSFFGSRFSLSFTWGSPYYFDYYGGYYSPFYRDLYWNRLRNPYAYNYYRYYQNSGHGYYGGSDRKADSNVRYGRRSIGTDRVNGNVSRTRNTQRVSGRDGNVSSSSKSSVRTRSSVGTTRSRGTNSRSSGSTVKRSRSNNSNSSSSGNSRSRGNLNQQDQSDRSSNAIRVRGINRSEEQLRSRSDAENNLKRVRSLEVSDRSKEKKTTFFNRLKGFLKNNSSSFINSSRSSSGRSVGIRSSSRNNSNSSSVRSRSSSSSNNSSVSRSSSSSSNSKSRSSGGSSRSRSGGGGDSSSSERSRGNN